MRDIIENDYLVSDLKPFDVKPPGEVVHDSPCFSDSSSSKFYEFCSSNSQISTDYVKNDDCGAFIPPLREWGDLFCDSEGSQPIIKMLKRITVMLDDYSSANENYLFAMSSDQFERVDRPISADEIFYRLNTNSQSNRTFTSEKSKTEGHVELFSVYDYFLLNDYNRRSCGFRDETELSIIENISSLKLHDSPSPISSNIFQCHDSLQKL